MFVCLFAPTVQATKIDRVGENADGQVHAPFRRIPGFARFVKGLHPLNVLPSARFDHRIPTKVMAIVPIWICWKSLR